MDVGTRVLASRIVNINIRSVTYSCFVIVTQELAVVYVGLGKGSGIAQLLGLSRLAWGTVCVIWALLRD